MCWHRSYSYLLSGCGFAYNDDSTDTVSTCSKCEPPGSLCIMDHLLSNIVTFGLSCLKKEEIKWRAPKRISGQVHAGNVVSGIGRARSTGLLSGLACQCQTIHPTTPN